MTKPAAKKMTTLEFVKAIIEVAKLSFKAAPRAVIFKLSGILVTAGLPIIITFFASQTISKLTAAYSGVAGAGRTAFTYVVITAVLGLCTTVWNSIDQYVQQSMRYTVESKVADMMYRHFLSLEFWQYDDKKTADIYERAQKFSQFYAYIFDHISGLVSRVVTMIFALGALFIFQPVIALFVLIAILPGVYLQFKISRSNINLWNQNVDARRSKSWIEWNLLQPLAITELRLLGLADYIMKLRQTYRDRDERARLDFERKYIVRRLLADGLQALTELGSLLWIVIQIINRRQAIGQFIYVQQLVTRALESATSFVSELGTLDEDLANLYDYKMFMDFAITAPNGHKLLAEPNTITVKDVSFKYPQSKKLVLENISFTIHKGQHVAIIGENGAGKSTLIKILTGLYRPSSGQVLLDSVPLSDIDIASWHAQVSVLQQEFTKYSFTDVKNNVYFGNVNRKFDQAAIDQALVDAEAKEFVDKLPQKQATLPDNWMEDADGNTGTNLSGGQWQRLALARNFYRKAPVIILDEPTSAIDALAEARIFDRLFKKDNHKTVITISHRLSTVEKADVILVLHNGKLVEQGTQAELVALKGQYYRLFERQLRK